MPANGSVRNMTLLMARCAEQLRLTGTRTCSFDGIDALATEAIHEMLADSDQRRSGARTNGMTELAQTGGSTLEHIYQRCYNDCRGFGDCDAGTCVCHDGHRGLDCAEDSEGLQVAEESPDAFIYVYEMPNDLGLGRMHESFGDAIYAAEVAFLRSLMSNWAERTADRVSKPLDGEE